MKNEKTDKLIRIFLPARIDANNAAEVDNEITGIIGEDVTKDVVLDASEMTYISSAGLRVIMKLVKNHKASVTVENASRDVYDIFEVTGFIDLIDVKKAYRKMSVEGCDIIGKGFVGTVYRVDPETIIKVYRGKDSIPKILDEQTKAKKAFVSGIPTAISYDIVQVGEDYGSVFELLNAKTFNDLVIEGERPLEDIVDEYVDFLHLVHSITMEPGSLPGCKDVFLRNLEDVKGYFTDKQYDDYKAFLESLPDENHVVHGDFQMKNVMLNNGEPMLIDMDTLGLGSPIFDLQGLYVTYVLFNEDDKDNSMSFLGIDSDTTARIWELVFDKYYKDLSESEKAEELRIIRLLASVRFLHIIYGSALEKCDLGQKRIATTLRHLDELL